MQDIPNENFVDDDNKKDGTVEIIDNWTDEQAVSEREKLRTLIKTVVGRNIRVLLDQ